MGLNRESARSAVLRLKKEGKIDKKPSVINPKRNVYYIKQINQDVQKGDSNRKESENSATVDCNGSKPIQGESFDPTVANGEIDQQVEILNSEQIEENSTIEFKDIRQEINKLFAQKNMTTKKEIFSYVGKFFNDDSIRSIHDLSDEQIFILREHLMQ